MRTPIPTPIGHHRGYFTPHIRPAGLDVDGKSKLRRTTGEGLIQDQSSFAGHSLGEYAALAAFADYMPIEDLVTLVFYRGLTMQVCVERDDSGRTNSMCALNPSRVSQS
jgi:fatty acid synthase subunit beta